jgi:hypothetical protein
MPTATLIVGCGGAGEMERAITPLAADPVVCVDVLLSLGRVATDHVGGACPAVPPSQVRVHARESGRELLQHPVPAGDPFLELREQDDHVA